MNRNSFLFTSIAATVLTLGFSHVLAQQEPVVKKFSLCTEDQPFFPHTSPDPTTPGHAQILVEMVAKNLGVTIEHRIEPWRRCQATVEEGKVDAINCAGYAGINTKISTFPMTGKEPSPTKAIAVTPTVLYRKVGSKADLVNGKLVNLTEPVAVSAGHQVNMTAIVAAGGRPEGAKTMDQNIRKLLADRVGLVAGDGELIELAEKTYAGKLERISTPLVNSNYYLAFSNRFYRENKEFVEKFWSEIEKVRKSPDYLKRIK